MKRILLLVALLLALVSCKRETPMAATDDLDKRVLAECGADAPFLAADPDFVATNFGEMTFVTDATVYLAESFDGTEFGVFHLSDKKHEKEMIARIRSYLEGEREAVQALAALYPAEELTARLARFDNAVVGASGDVVYYFLMDPPLMAKAQNALK